MAYLDQTTLTEIHRDCVEIGIPEHSMFLRCMLHRLGEQEYGRALGTAFNEHIVAAFNTQNNEPDLSRANTHIACAVREAVHYRKSARSIMARIEARGAK